jgi:hypothetical protein
LPIPAEINALTALSERVFISAKVKTASAPFSSHHAKALSFPFFSASTSNTSNAKLKFSGMLTEKFV